MAKTPTRQHTTDTTSMPPVGFEPTISVGKQPYTYILDCAATGTSSLHLSQCLNSATTYNLKKTVNMLILLGIKANTMDTEKERFLGNISK
jgi:hypothetical protein